MADAYWRYVEGRQQSAALPPNSAKRLRSDYGISLCNYSLYFSVVKGN